MKIPYLDLKQLNAPYEAELKAALAGVVDSGWYLFGHEVGQFEREWSAYVGTAHTVAVSNGLDALRLVLRAWIELGELHAGDEVIVPANTYIASILAVSDSGLVPVPVEPDPDTWLLTADGVRRALTPRTRAVLPVHLYGQTCQMEEIMAEARRHGLKVLEDCAQSHGSTLTLADGTTRRSGALGHAAAFSFYPGKNLGALGDAGCVTTDDARLAETVRRLAFYGSERKYVHIYKGMNCRMDEMQAACLRVKLPHLEAVTRRRKEIAERYQAELTLPGLTLPTVRTDHVWHIYPILCPRRDALQQHLAQRGIGTQIHYPIAPHRQQAYAEWATLRLPLTERIAAEELSLPCHPAMTDADAAAVVAAVREFVCDA